MVRMAQRTLTGSLRGYGSPDVRMGAHEQGGTAVTVDLRGFNGTRTFNDPEALEELAASLLTAANWLRS